MLDKKTGFGSITMNGTQVYQGYYANLSSVTDYYPFGMQMVGRSKANSDYRFGYATGEKDNEIAGFGIALDYGERGYDTRIARLNWRPDPLEAKYPWQSPYVYASNNPIKLIDYNGEGGVDPGPTNLKKTIAIIGNISWGTLGAMTYSNNFKPYHMWQVAHGYNNCWTCFQGAVGEGVAAQSIEAIMTATNGAWAINAVAFNLNQTPLGKATTGTWDLKLTTRATKNESFLNLLDNYYGHIDIGTDLPNGGREEFVQRDFIKAGEKFTYYYEIKTLSPNSSAGYSILAGFAQATNTAKIHKNEKSVSVLFIDKDAFNYAYQNGFKEKIDASFDELRKAGGVLLLSNGQTSRAKAEMIKLYDAVKKATSEKTE